SNLNSVIALSWLPSEPTKLLAQLSPRPGGGGCEPTAGRLGDNLTPADEFTRKISFGNWLWPSSPSKSCRALFAFGCWLLGGLASTLAVVCHSTLALPPKHQPLGECTPSATI